MSHHTFDINIAQQYGIEAALLIHHIAYWIEFNERAGKNFHEGKTWMYQTQYEMSLHFPYIDYWKIHRTLKDLIEKGILIKGNFNKNKFDKTIWYTFKNKEMFTKLQKRKIEPSDQQFPDCESATCIYTDTKTDAKEEDSKSPSPKPLPKETEKNDDDGPENIHYLNPKEEDKLITQSEIYRHFVRSNYPTEIIRDAIQCFRDQAATRQPFSNPLAYLEKVCFTLVTKKNKKAKPLPEKPKKEELSRPKCTAPRGKTMGEMFNIPPPKTKDK